MGDILEQEELDALIGEGAEGLITDNTDDIRGGGEKYDFASQEYAVSRLIPACHKCNRAWLKALSSKCANGCPA